MIFQFGTITNPLDVLAPKAGGAFRGQFGQGAGLVILGNNLIKLALVVGGIYAFVNIILAGYIFLSSTESKDFAKAWAKIWQSMLGLLIMAGSFVLAAIFGWIIFGDPTMLISPKLFAP